MDKLVLSGNGDYRLDVYAFFANHSETKEREKYLSHYHGEYSGSHAGNDNTTYTYKQLHFSHGGISQPYAQVTLTWNKVLRRVESLMQSGKWLSEADRAAMGDYELKQLARTMLLPLSMTLNAVGQRKNPPRHLQSRQHPKRMRTICCWMSCWVRLSRKSSRHRQTLRRQRRKKPSVRAYLRDAKENRRGYY